MDSLVQEPARGGRHRPRPPPYPTLVTSSPANSTLETMEVQNGEKKKGVKHRNPKLGLGAHTDEKPIRERAFPPPDTTDPSACPTLPSATLINVSQGLSYKTVDNVATWTPASVVGRTFYRGAA